jgi:diguanylate cyclase (GGDEF)-like protein
MSPEALELQRIIKQKLITPVFQPIVDLTNGKIFAYEALSRGPQNSCLFRPDRLFAEAKKEKCLWQLDYLCRSLALLHAKDFLQEELLFINVDANILYDHDFHQGTTAKLLAENHMNAKNIIFEVSEKTAISDYASFRAILENYQQQNYRIAIDDVGAGYSGLNLLTQISPQFIKLDIGLIRDIDSNYTKKSMIKALADFASATHIATIAEGIERVEELNILIDLGINYGQGFLLGHPAPDFSGIAAGIQQKVRQTYIEKKSFQFCTLQNMNIGKITLQQKAFSPDTPGHVIFDYFRSAPDDIEDVIIAEHGIPVGILNHNLFYQHLATTYGVSLYSGRPIKLLMNTQPLIIDYDTSVEETAAQALARNTRHTYESIIVTRNGQYYGTVTIKKLLTITTRMEINRAQHANPLTGLPGNNIIEGTLSQHIKSSLPFAVIYIDLDNFKVYNDIYGFESGDKVLIHTAHILHQVLANYTNHFFLGHIGGDDFIAVIKTNDISKVCEAIIDCFDAQSKQFYSAEHQFQQYVIAKNRHGQTEEFPLMSISLAVLHIVNKNKLTTTMLATKAAEIKKKAKATRQSSFVIENCG